MNANEQRIERIKKRSAQITESIRRSTEYTPLADEMEEVLASTSAISIVFASILLSAKMMGLDDKDFNELKRSIYEEVDDIVSLMLNRLPDVENIK
jgi:CRISPR/Cas system type I-B associated protein Csh2 (Cas7 group RAMP superfamily)